MRRILEASLTYCPVLWGLAIIRDTADSYLQVLEWIAMETIEHIEEMERFFDEREREIIGASSG